MSKRTPHKIKNSYDYELIAITYHEAGHAIMATLNVMQAIRIKINKKTDLSGYTDWISLDESKFKDKTLIKILATYQVEINYAGLIAEQIYYKDICGSNKIPQALKYGSESDRSSASNIIKKYDLAPPGKGRKLLKDKIQKNIKKVLTENWDAIKLVAHFLYKNKEMSHQELKNILLNKTNNKLLWKQRFDLIELFYNSKNELKESDYQIILNNKK